jgi:hypothetical protein
LQNAKQHQDFFPRIPFDYLSGWVNFSWCLIAHEVFLVVNFYGRRDQPVVVKGFYAIRLLRCTWMEQVIPK